MKRGRVAVILLAACGGHHAAGRVDVRGAALAIDRLEVSQARYRHCVAGAGFAASQQARRTTKRAPYDPGKGYPNVGLRCVYAAR
jgi:hypothetical protein